MEVDMPNGKTVVVNKTGEGYGDVKAKVEPQGPGKNYNIVPGTMMVVEDY
jgi:hypothetical protein